MRSNASAAASQAGDSIVEKVSDARDHVGDAASRAADTAQGFYEKAKATASDIGDRVPQSAGETWDAGRRAYANGSDRVGRQVARQPIEALLLAGAIGYLVGWAANRG